MSDDGELLQCAARAAGATHVVPGHCCGIQGRRYDGAGLLCDNGLYWNPLTDNGDALRLAVACDIHVAPLGCVVQAVNESGLVVTEDRRDDPLAATRRAIVRAAAEVGRAMP